MIRIQVQIETSFGEIVIEGETPQEILRTLRTMSPKFIEEVRNLVSGSLAPTAKTQLEGIIEVTTEGPIVTTREKLTHYEAIGLVIFASEEKTNTAAQITRLLASSGIKAMVPARLNEMTKRGLVFKPDPSRPEFRLTTQGERWVEEELLTKLKSSSG